MTNVSRIVALRSSIWRIHKTCRLPPTSHKFTERAPRRVYLRALADRRAFAPAALMASSHSEPLFDAALIAKTAFAPPRPRAPRPWQDHKEGKGGREEKEEEEEEEEKEKEEEEEEEAGGGRSE